MTRSVAFLFVGLTVFFTVFGQLSIKYKAAQMGEMPPQFPDRLSYFLELFLSPWIIAGFISAVFAAIFWILAMTKLPISLAYPFMALSFPLVVIASHILFGEYVSSLRMIGVALICAGVILVNHS